jgi:hypothetical protein
MDGHADNAPANLESLADFLSDTPEEESQDQEMADDTESEEDTQDESSESESDEKEESDEESEDEAKASSQAPQIYKVTVKDADGNDQEMDVPSDELVKGYQRQADYTRKMQSLVDRESKALEFVQEKVNESREHYLQQAQLAQAAVAQLAGLKTEQEMAALANSDPAAWVAEKQRQEAIRGLLGNLGSRMQAETQQRQQEAQQAQQRAMQAAYDKTWQVLSKEGIDKPKLADIYKKASDKYGWTSEELGQVYDARVIQMMRDAVSYRELQAKKSEVTKKVDKAPPLPTRNTPKASERQVQKVNEKFRDGRAKLGDLASFLASHR